MDGGEKQPHRDSLEVKFVSSSFPLIIAHVELTHCDGNRADLFSVSGSNSAVLKQNAAVCCVPVVNYGRTQV